MARTGRRRSRRGGRATAHALAGFVLGVLAFVTAFAFAGPPQAAPVSDAADRAATAAAVRMTLDPAASPAAEAQPMPIAHTLLPDDERDLLLRPRGATRIVVPAVGIDAQVSSVGYTYRDGALAYDVPRLGAGHYVGTASPGEAGNTVIGGHVVNRGAAAAFADLPHVRAGDIVEVYRGAEVFRYSVMEIRVVAADATAVMSQTQDATLTLITCFPDRDYQQRLVVVGRLVKA